MFAKHMAALGLYVMDIPGVPAGDPAAVVEVDLATPLCGAVAHTIDKLETHSLAPAARVAPGRRAQSARESLWSWLTENPMRVLVFAFVARNILKKKEPFPECGGRVVGVHDTKAFDGALASAKAKGELLVDVDECKELARREGIAAMPTFKIYRDGACV
ncbi:hypothetical protein JL720_13235 [Aureococcus anophagefferens]|nr:hypothetical protein JL720_13235 [Aureococcus anophagefferens]